MPILETPSKVYPSYLTLCSRCTFVGIFTFTKPHLSLRTVTFVTRLFHTQIFTPGFFLYMYSYFYLKDEFRRKERKIFYLQVHSKMVPVAKPMCQSKGRSKKLPQSLHVGEGSKHLGPPVLVPQAISRELNRSGAAGTWTGSYMRSQDLQSEGVAIEPSHRAHY